jgi:Bacterial Ig domain/Calcineurin-like phosphoesterase
MIRRSMRAGLVVAVVVAACGLALGGLAFSRPGDKKPPRVSITAPSAGATLSGTVTLSASASDNVGVTRVTWYVDGTQVASDTSAPWSQPWNSATVADGGHSVVAKAQDAAGNVGTSAGVSFTVANGGPPPAGDPVIAAAGDIAGSGTGDEATARLLDSIAPTAVLTTGDNAYESGTLAEFNSFYDPTWGRHRAVTHPVPGNHEYNTAGAAGYFDYFGAAAGDRAKGYYSYNIGAWHLIALNSEIAHDAGSVQVAWLKGDLAASTAKCTLAYWHKPRFTAGNYSDFPEYVPFWQALWDANADVVLAGHDHNYQRYTPLNPSGIADSARGLREFVVGTGGRSHYALRADNRRAAGNATTFGVLKLTLHPASFDFSFVPEAGQTYSDSGSAIACH